MNLEIACKVEELSDFIPFLIDHVDGPIQFPESSVSQHSTGTFYRLDYVELSSIIISISGGITSIAALITAIISFKKEKLKTNKEQDSPIIIIFNKKTVTITSNSIAKDVYEELSDEKDDPIEE